MMTQFLPGDRVVVEHPQHGRHYGTVVGPYEFEKPAHIVRVEGLYAYPDWKILEAWMQVPFGQRDMVIGDLLNIDMLKDAIEKEFIGTLWVKGDRGPLTPFVCATSFGDGMHLLKISTINQRPNYHVVRVCSSWRESYGSNPWSAIRGETIGDHIDDIISAIEEECGERYLEDVDCPTCGPSGEDCRCDGGRPWPAIQADDGCMWGNIEWTSLMDLIGYTKIIEAPAASALAA